MPRTLTHLSHIRVHIYTAKCIQYVATLTKIINDSHEFTSFTRSLGRWAMLGTARLHGIRFRVEFELFAVLTLSVWMVKLKWFCWFCVCFSACNTHGANCNEIIILWARSVSSARDDNPFPTGQIDILCVVWWKRLNALLLHFTIFSNVLTVGELKKGCHEIKINLN